MSRKSTPRYLYPLIKSFCSSGLPSLHGSETIEATGSVVEVPALGAGAGSGGGHGGQGGRDFPGGGADTLVGGSGVNRYDAGSGNDVVKAANGRRELVSCGRGRDRAQVDRNDRVRSCEQITH